MKFFSKVCLHNFCHGKKQKLEKTGIGFFMKTGARREVRHLFLRNRFTGRIFSGVQWTG